MDSAEILMMKRCEKRGNKLNKKQYTDSRAIREKKSWTARAKRDREQISEGLMKNQAALYLLEKINKKVSYVYKAEYICRRRSWRKFPRP